MRSWHVYTSYMVVTTEHMLCSTQVSITSRAPTLMPINMSTGVRKSFARLNFASLLQPQFPDSFVIFTVPHHYRKNTKFVSSTFLSFLLFMSDQHKTKVFWPQDLSSHFPTYEKGYIWLCIYPHHHTIRIPSSCQPLIYNYTLVHSRPNKSTTKRCTVVQIKNN